MTPTALDLDQVLKDMDPDISAAIREAMPVSLRDQIASAARDSRGIAGIALGNEGQAVTASEVAPWLRLSALSELVSWFQGSESTCTHDPNPARPQSVWAAAWRPNLIVCGSCVHLLGSTRATDKNCDCCGRDTTGENALEVITLVGALAYLAFSCRECVPIARQVDRTE